MSTNNSNGAASWGDNGFLRAPYCYICGYIFTAWFKVADRTWKKNRPHPGVYPADELINMKFWRGSYWWNRYRMILLNPSNNKCRLSGVAFYHSEDFDSLAVPWDKDEGVIGYEMEKGHLATRTVLEPWEEPSDEELVGYPIHARCWEFLCRHPIGDMAQRNLKGILYILRQKHDEWKYGTDRSEATEYLMEAADIGYFKPIQSLINRARQRTSKRFKSRGRFNRQSQFYYIPTEILHMILDNLLIEDVVAVQRALASYLGVSYWRSRISIDIYHEVRNVINETLDWGFLCLGLENLSKTWDGEEGLVCRRYLLKRLDEIQAASTLL